MVSFPWSPGVMCGTALLWSVLQAGMAVSLSTGSILQLLFGESFFSSPSTGNVQSVVKRLTRWEESVQCVHTASPSSKMCCMGKKCSCAGLKFASWCSCLWASSIYGLKELKRQDLPWLWESSGQEIETWLQKAAVSCLCQAVDALAEDGSELEQSLPACLFCRHCLQVCQPGFHPPDHEQSQQPLLTVQCHLGLCGDPLQCSDRTWGEALVRVSLWLCFLQHFFSYTVFPAPSFTAEKCQTSSHIIRLRNSNFPLLNRLRVMNQLKINALYE